MADEILKDQFREEEISPEKLLRIKQDVAVFSRELIKVILQTGFYSEKHPLTYKIIGEIYQIFKELTEGFDEVSFIIASGAEQNDILVEGLTPDSLHLMNLLKGEMGEHFIKKFIDYFNRNRLVSFTIKSNIDPDEFEKFIRLVVKWHLMEKEMTKDGQVLDNFTDSIINEGILSVSVVHLTDLVGHDRQLPWQCKIVMTRLRKDIRLLPMMAEKSGKDIAILKRQVIADIVRPIRRQEFVKEMLLNADIITKDIPGAELLDVEQAIINSISLYLVITTCIKLTELFTHVSVKELKSTRKIAALNDIKTILKKLAIRLDESQDIKAQEILDDFSRKGILKLEELPRRVRDRILAMKISDDFILNESSQITKIEKEQDLNEYSKLIYNIALIIPEFLKRRKYALVFKLFSIIQYQTSEPASWRLKYINDFFKKLAESGTLKLIATTYSHEKKEYRDILAKIFPIFGTDCIYPLLHELFTSDKSQVRHEIYSMLIEFGGTIRPVIEKELSSDNKEWYMIRNLIFILGSVGNSDSSRLITAFLTHHHSRVKEECAAALYKLIGVEAEPYLLGLLQDEDVGVKKKVIHFLALIKTRMKPFFYCIKDCIKPKYFEEDEADESLQLACLRAIADFAPEEIPSEFNIEDIIISSLRKRKFLDFLKKIPKYREKPFVIKKHMIEVLVKIGTSNSIQIFETLKKDKDEKIRKYASEASENLKKRLNVE
jgi:hypothetical protein